MRWNVRSQDRPKTGLCAKQLGTQVVSSKEKFLKEIKSATSVNTQTIRRQNRLYCQYEELDWSGSNQPQHSLKLRLNPVQGPNSLPLYES